MDSLDTWISLVKVIGPVGACLALFVAGFRLGWWRTPQEVEAIKRERDAEKDRRVRAENQVDVMLPAMDRLTEAINRRVER